jgi:hypothetical protein
MGGRTKAVTQAGSPPEIGELRRCDLSVCFEERATFAITLHTAGFAQDGDVAYIVAPKNEAECTYGCPAYDIHRLDGLSFEPAPELQLE